MERKEENEKYSTECKISFFFLKKTTICVVFETKILQHYEIAYHSNFPRIVYY